MMKKIAFIWNVIWVLLTGCGSGPQKDVGDSANPIVQETILAAGDSISSYRENDKQYFEWLQEALPQTKVIVGGVPGNTTMPLLDRLNHSAFPSNIDHVIILIGVNDATEECKNNDWSASDQYQTNLKAIVEGFQDHGAKEIVLMTPFVIQNAEEPTQPASATFFPCLVSKIGSYQAVMKSVADEYHLKVVDMQAVYDEAVSGPYNPHDLTLDGIHPNALGNQLMANELMKEIKL